MEKLNIMDWYVHQGHQYEFFKTGHNFYLSAANGQLPNWNADHRPLLSNINQKTEKECLGKKYDVVIVRSPIPVARYEIFVKRGAIPVAVVQTTSPFKVPKYVKHMVWNSLSVMEKYKVQFPWCKHYHIVHGFDPQEFKRKPLDRNGKILTVANVFKTRNKFMGYDLWQHVSQNVTDCDVVGHGNEDILGSLPEAETFEKLLETYSKYNAFFNPTRESAMPRSRGEAAMMGLPIVSTKNFDIDLYFQNGKSAILTNDRDEIIKALNDLKMNPELVEERGRLAREAAIKHFHINDYLQKWNDIFRKL
jgi:glycosyltransferase involved in cell wall biosynthesis